jgi:hypothetical protein
MFSSFRVETQLFLTLMRHSPTHSHALQAGGGPAMTVMAMTAGSPAVTATRCVQFQCRPIPSPVNPQSTPRNQNSFQYTTPGVPYRLLTAVPPPCLPPLHLPLRTVRQPSTAGLVILVAAGAWALWQGLTLVHCSAQLEPCLTHK